MSQKIIDLINTHNFYSKRYSPHWGINGHRNLNHYLVLRRNILRLGHIDWRAMGQKSIMINQWATNQDCFCNPESHLDPKDVYDSGEKLDYTEGPFPKNFRHTKGYNPYKTLIKIARIKPVPHTIISFC